MKKCLTCNQFFGDENDFCLEDGTRLVWGAPTQGFAGSESSAEVPTQYIRRPLATRPAAGGNSKWLYLIIGILGATVVVGGLFIFFGSYGTDKKPASETVKTESSPLNASTPEPKKPATPINPTAPATIPPTAPPRPAVSTARVRFAKGAVTSSVSGSLSEGEVKNYLLACRAGQQLTATLSASNSCVTFTDGSTVFRAITRRGDNTLAVTSRCVGGPYRLDITIL